MEKEYYNKQREEYKDSCLYLYYLNIMENIYNEDVKKENNNIKFICERSFHPPFSIKVEWGKNEQTGIYSLFIPPLPTGGRENVSRYEKIIIDKHINNLLSIIEKHDYFNTIYPERTGGYDGSDWTIEVKINNDYKKVEEWTPTKGIVHEIGHYLLNLSDIKIEPIF